MSNGEIILYTTVDGKASVKLRAEEGTVWLTRTEIADLFQTSPQNITLHIQGICEENEVDIAGVHGNFVGREKLNKNINHREHRVHRGRKKSFFSL